MFFIKKVNSYFEFMELQSGFSIPCRITAISDKDLARNQIANLAYNYGLM